MEIDVEPCAYAHHQRDPEMAEAVRSGTKFREEFMKQQLRFRQTQAEKDRMIEVRAL